MLGFVVEVGAFFPSGSPPHEGVIGKGGPGERFNELLVRGGGGVVKGFVGVFELEGEEGGLIIGCRGFDGSRLGVCGAGTVGRDAAATAGKASSKGVAESTVAAEIALAGFHFFALGDFDCGPGFFFSFLGAGWRDGDEDIKYVCFYTQDVVGRARYPAISWIEVSIT